MRDADELQISKHHARTLAAVVQEYLDPGVVEPVVQGIGQGPDRLATVVADGGDRDREGCERLRPDYPPRVVVLLDRGGHHPGDADPVAAHLHGPRLTARIEKGCT